MSASIRGVPTRGRVYLITRAIVRAALTLAVVAVIVGGVAAFGVAIGAWLG